MRVAAWSPSRHDWQGSLWPRSRLLPAPLGVAPSCPPPPPPALRSGTVRSPPFEWDPAPT